MNRREFLRIAAAGALGAPVVQAAGDLVTPARRPPPNVVILFSDDQRARTIHALGCEEILTPRLDALAGGGAAFTQAHIMGGTQSAVCVPSRNMLMTGRSLFRLGGKGSKGDVILPDYVTLPEHLRAHGYRTCAVGKWHNDRESFLRSFTDKSDILFGGMGPHRNLKLEWAQHAVKDRFSSEIFSAAAIDFIGQQRADKPFLLYVAYTAPHDPRTPPEQYRAMYDETKLPLPPNFLPAHPFDNGALMTRDEKLAPFPRTPEAIRKHIADYYGMITHLDAQIGRVLEALAASPHAGNTIVIFAGDNGLALGQHGLMGKQSVYEHSVGVPLLIRGPGIVARQVPAWVYTFDIFPTVCALAGIAPPATCEGLNLLPVLRGESTPVRNEFFFAHTMAQRAVRSDNWKLIHYPRVNVTQLFDLEADPWETANLADQPRQAAIVAQMRARLAALQERYGDPLARPGRT